MKNKGKDLKPEEVVAKITEHDYALEKVAESVNTLAKSIEVSGKTTNIKLDNIAESLSRQAVIMEKLENLESKVSDNSSRTHRRIEALEHLAKSTIENRDTRGCQYGRESQIKLDNLEKSIKDKFLAYENRVKNLEDSKTWLVRIIVSKVIAVIVGVMVLLFKG